MSADTADSDSHVVIRERGPPASEFMYAVINPLIALLLKSPLHSLLSDSLMLITFTGRRTGREYTTPVGYYRRDGRLLVFTHSEWWKNLRGGAVVTLRLRGEHRRGEAVPITDEQAVAEHVHRLIEEHGIERARRLGLEIEGTDRPTVEQIREGLETTVAIEIELDDRRS